MRHSRGLRWRGSGEESVTETVKLTSSPSPSCILFNADGKLAISFWQLWKLIWNFSWTKKNFCHRLRRKHRRNYYSPADASCMTHKNATPKYETSQHNNKQQKILICLKAKAIREFMRFFCVSIEPQRTKKEKWLSHGTEMVLCGVLKVMFLSLSLRHEVTQMSYFSVV